jgi:Glycosyl transferase family 2
MRLKKHKAEASVTRRPNDEFSLAASTRARGASLVDNKGQIFESGDAINPFFSVCIPQHNRTDFLLKSLASLFNQRFRDFEVCISDDNSSDGRQEEIIEELHRSGIPYLFKIQKENRRYDFNLRAAMGLARGQYCFLLGNDDALLDEHTLCHFYKAIADHGPCGVIISNFQDYGTGLKVDRVRFTGNKGAGPDVATRHFRNFSFVSGVVLDRNAAQVLATEQWDGSEMYQMFVGCRIIASGKSLVEIAEPLIRKDIRLPNLRVDSYATRPRERPWPIVERTIPLAQLGRLTVDAISPYVSGVERRRTNARILRQLFIFTYPFWIFEYRRVQSWPYAVGIVLGMRPKRAAAGIKLTATGRLLVHLQYATSSLIGLVVPQRLFKCARPFLYFLAKRS